MYLTKPCISPNHAYHALQDGLHWEGNVHDTEMMGFGYLLSRCGKCQAYGHRDNSCSSQPAKMW